jgi:hypothetical protein
VSTVAKKTSKRGRPEEPARRAGWLRSRAVKRILLVVIVLAVAVEGSLVLWPRVRGHVAAQPEYMVAAEDIEVTPIPPWIHTDIKAEVIRDAGLKKKISILDEHASDRLSEAFAMSPWVERVAGVHTSYPAHIQVDLVYRRPVAMVAVPGGLLPIDAASVVLPTAGFSTVEAQSYPRIIGVSSSPRGLVGTPWGDVEVERAARLAVLFQDVWQSLDLHDMQVPQSESDFAAGAGFQIATRGGTVFAWGTAPGDEAEGEMKAADKVARLVKLASDYKTLDATPKAQRDLRRAQGL